MADSKLTLSADKEVIEAAKKLARENRTSVSAMFSRLLLAMTSDRSSAKALGPITRKATVLVRLPANKGDEQLLEEALAGKYGLRS